MKQIIAGLNAIDFSPEQLIHFNNVSNQIGGNLVVVFLENLVSDILMIPRPYPDGAYAFNEEIDWQRLEERKKQIAIGMKLFHSTCETHHLNLLLREETGDPVADLVKESRFADMLLLDSSISNRSSLHHDTEISLKSVLHNAQCPVMIIPPQLTAIKEFVFTYNGSYSSMYAIRQATQLLEKLQPAKVTVLYVDEKNTGKLTEEKLLAGYLGAHFKNWDLAVCNGEPSVEILDFLQNRPGSLVTLGAYGRSRLSTFFHKSESDKILLSQLEYVFITHP